MQEQVYHWNNLSVKVSNSSAWTACYYLMKRWGQSKRCRWSCLRQISMKERSLEQGARITSFSKPHGSLKHWQQTEHPGSHFPMPAAFPGQWASSRPQEFPWVQQRPKDTQSLSAGDLSEDCWTLCQARRGKKNKILAEQCKCWRVQEEPRGNGEGQDSTRRKWLFV